MENPYGLDLATGKNFIGRTDILASWRDRLTPGSDTWDSAKSWMVVGAGGMGKTSLLHKLNRVAEDEFKAYTIPIDLGRLRDIGDIDDLFAILSTAIPKAKQPGTILRKWFGLQPNAPLSDLVGQIAGELLNQGTSFAMGLAGAGAIKIANFREKPSERQGTAHRLVQLLDNLSLISEEQENPVIVILDQFGKCYDHPTWAYIAGMFLGLCKVTHSKSASSIFFVVSFRPEQEGLLHHIDRSFFKEDIFTPIDLSPLKYEEAIEAIAVRGEGYIDTNLARRIVEEVNYRGPLDPYTIQLSSMAVWNFIAGGEHWHSPKDLEDDTEKLRSIIRQGHDQIIHPFIQDPVLWGILVQLSQSQVGLNLSELRSRLSAEHNLSTSEVKSAVDSLLSPPGTGYRLLTEIRRKNLPSHYVLAHDLLRDYILSIIPEDQRLIAQATRTLEYGLWQYQEQGELLADWELELLWNVHPNLTFKPEHWGMVIKSELPLGNRRLFRWYHNYSEEIRASCKEYSQDSGKNTFDIRLFLFLFFISLFSNQSPIRSGQSSQYQEMSDGSFRTVSDLTKLAEITLPIFAELAHRTEDDDVRLEAAKILAQLGDKGTALLMLSELARSGILNYLCLEAVIAVGQLGDKETALPILSELAQNGKTNYFLRVRAAIAVGQLGDKETALPILFELVHSDSHIRLQTIKILEQLGDNAIALPILSELAQNGRNNYVRVEAAIAVGQLGDKETALPILSELARTGETNYLRVEAAIAVGQLGDKETALPILSELARTGQDYYLRVEAAKAVGQLGKKKITLPILSELAQNAGVDSYRLEAAKAVGQLGKKKIALPILAELARSGKTNYVRVEAAIAVEQLGKKGIALPILFELAQNAEFDSYRLEAAEALGRLGYKEIALPILAELAQSLKDYEGHVQAVEALRQLGDAETALLVLAERARTHEHIYERLWGAKRLADLGGKEIALQILIQLQHAGDENFRAETIKAIAMLGELANKELLMVAVVEPFSRIGGIAIIELIKNSLPEYFSEDLSKLSKP